VDTVVSGRVALSPLWVEDDCPQQAVVRGSPPGTGRPRAAAAWTAALEHEARGLLNLIVIASRCLETSADDGEREAWRQEIHAAREHLDGLYQAGLPLDFPKDPFAGPRRSGGSHPDALHNGGIDCASCAADRIGLPEPPAPLV
jgi:hypothetical protein